MRASAAGSATTTVVAMLLMSGLAPLALAMPALASGPILKNGSFTSINWSGYAVTGPAGSVTDVKGSWNVPSIVGSCPSKSQYSSFWVGIDGFNSNTVEQTGTDSDCQSGRAVYYAWYEFYPAASVLISGLTISPRDKISAEVSYSSGVFTVAITDTTTGRSFSMTGTVSSAQRSSAEWIAEAPSSGTILPLADFGTVQFGYDYTGVASTGYATVSGSTGTIGSFGAAVQVITMVTRGGIIKAQPSALTSDGTSFSVTWHHS